MDQLNGLVDSLRLNLNHLKEAVVLSIERLTHSGSLSQHMSPLWTKAAQISQLLLPSTIETLAFVILLTLAAKIQKPSIYFIKFTLQSVAIFLISLLASHPVIALTSVMIYIALGFFGFNIWADSARNNRKYGFFAGFLISSYLGATRYFDSINFCFFRPSTSIISPLEFTPCGDWSKYIIHVIIFAILNEITILIFGFLGLYRRSHNWSIAYSQGLQPFPKWTLAKIFLSTAFAVVLPYLVKSAEYIPFGTLG